MKLTIEEAKRIIDENNGNLTLAWTGYTELPDPLEVPGDLNLYYSHIQKLPDDLKVGGFLDIERSDIKDLNTKKLIVGKTFFLSNMPIENLPDYLEVGEDLYAQNSSITHLSSQLIVRGACWLSYTNILEIPDNAVFGGSLRISNTKVSKLPDHLHFINGTLDISKSQISELPDPLTVKWSLCAEQSQLKAISNSLFIGSDMNISHTAVSKLPDGFIVPGALIIDGCPIKELPEKLIVGDSMSIQDTEISDIPESLTVNGYIFADFGVNEEEVSKLRNGDYEEGRYLYIDWIPTHIKRMKKIGKYDYYIGRIPGVNVVSDGTYYAHCENIREGIRDLEFKHAKDRGAEQYRGIDKDEPIPTSEMIEMYRIITGACRQGTEAFLQSLGKLKDAYTVREAIELTAGHYGSNDFKKFFE